MACGLGFAFAMMAGASVAEERRAAAVARSPITNGASWGSNGWASGLPDLKHPPVEATRLYQPETDWTYSHHSFLAVFLGRIYAAWANGRKDQDAPGQRVLISSTADFRSWTKPLALLTPTTDASGAEHILLPGGFHVHDGTLVLYFGDRPSPRETRKLRALATRDGEHWTPPQDLGVPLASCYGPGALASGTLLMPCDEAFFARSDDRGGRAGWQLTGFLSPEVAASTVTRVSAARKNGWPEFLTEPSFYQTDDGVIHMLMRNSAARRLWLTESRDDGRTWTAPVETEFSNAATKFYFGRLPDKRFFFVGNPLGEPRPRNPLVLSLSRDGVHFNQHFLLGDQHYELRRAGAAKYGEYAYPHAVVHEGHLYVIVSRQKEAIEVLRVALRDLSG